MIYLQLSASVSVPPGRAVRLCDIASLSAPQEICRLPVPCPDQDGIWRFSALQCVQLIHSCMPDAEISVIGAESCCIHRMAQKQHDPFKPLRTVLAFLILLFGSALGLAWFHSDVGMPDAMLDVYAFVTGSERPQDERIFTIPYIVGVALGTSVFYALGNPHAVTPLDVKLSDYRQDMERAEAKDVE